ARADTTAIAMPAMAGPYNDLTIVCAPCTTSAKMKRPSAPAREVRIVFSGDASVAPTPSNQLRHYLAIRTDRGWFLQDLGFSGVICGGRSQSGVHLSARDLKSGDVLGDQTPEIEVDVETTVMGRESQIDDRHHLICTFDANANPHCADLFVARRADRVESSWDYTIAIDRAHDTITLGHDGYGHADETVTLAMP
ncbi:MAG TPA: hypothetical protein VL463_23655, partial [Kofleriaceae bacterium]|nr:hypothetical protein [Kofleriaceae bacterium]